MKKVYKNRATHLCITSSGFMPERFKRGFHFTDTFGARAVVSHIHWHTICLIPLHKNTIHEKSYTTAGYSRCRYVYVLLRADFHLPLCVSRFQYQHQQDKGKGKKNRRRYVLHLAEQRRAEKWRGLCIRIAVAGPGYLGGA